MRDHSAYSKLRICLVYYHTIDAWGMDGRYSGFVWCNEWYCVMCVVFWGMRERERVDDGVRIVVNLLGCVYDECFVICDWFVYLMTVCGSSMGGVCGLDMWVYGCGRGWEMWDEVVRNCVVFVGWKWSWSCRCGPMMLDVLLNIKDEQDPTLVLRRSCRWFFGAVICVSCPNCLVLLVSSTYTGLVGFWCQII